MNQLVEDLLHYVNYALQINKIDLKKDIFERNLFQRSKTGKNGACMVFLIGGCITAAPLRNSFTTLSATHPSLPLKAAQALQI